MRRLICEVAVYVLTLAWLLWPEPTSSSTAAPWVHAYTEYVHYKGVKRSYIDVKYSGMPGQWIEVYVNGYLVASGYANSVGNFHALALAHQDYPAFGELPHRNAPVPYGVTVWESNLIKTNTTAGFCPAPCPL